MITSDLFSHLNYSPHVGQLKFHEHDNRFKLLIAGARFGKSLAASRDVLPELLSGETRGWLVGPTYALTKPEFRNLQDDIEGNLALKTEFHNSSGTGGYVKLPWGSEAWCLSAQLPQGLLGEEIDWLILCEAAHIKPDVFTRFLRARLTTRLGRLIIPTTPHGHNWIHALYQNADKQDDWLVQKHATWENPLIAKTEIELARKTLTPETFAEQFGGEFTARSGRVYPEFKLDSHVASEMNISAGQVVYRGLDFGFTNPFACVWLSQHHGQWQVLAEYTASGRVLDEHICSIKKIDDRLRSQGAVVGSSWADPSGALERETFQQAGIETQTADNHISGGIEVVRQQLVVSQA